MRKVTVAYPRNCSGTKNVYIDSAAWMQLLQACVGERAALEVVHRAAGEAADLRGRAFSDRINAAVHQVLAGKE